MAILGIVMGVTLGTFASFDPGRRAARGLVTNALRQARNTAVAQRAPARVVFDPESGRAATEGYVIAGTWRFETPSLTGARDVNGYADGFPGEYLSAGFVGKALDLDLGPRGSKVTIDLSDDPIFRLRRGFRLAFAIRPAALADARVIDLGKVVEGNARQDGSMEFKIATRRTDELGRSVPGETVTLRTGPAALDAGAWTQIEVIYDMQRMIVTANGVPVAERAETRELWDVSGALVLGGGRQRFRGRMDDLVLSVVTGEEDIQLPRSARFRAKGPFEVRFDESGGLDPVFHARPVGIELEYDDGTVETVTVRTLGTVES